MGRPPKHPDDRVRRNTDGYDDDGYRLPLPGGSVARSVAGPIKLPKWDGIRRGHNIPTHPYDPTGWHKSTRVWWLMWRDSSHAMFFLETDWEGLFITALLYDRIVKGIGSVAMMTAAAGELRKREGQLGASIEDRVRLNMASDEGDEEVADAVVTQQATSVVNYMERLTKAAAEKINPGG